MSFIDKPINWTGADAITANVVETIKMPKDEAAKRVKDLQDQIAVFLADAHKLYPGAPTSELGSVILMAENIERELEKLK
jgi:hypothetical protein